MTKKCFNIIVCLFLSSCLFEDDTVVEPTSNVETLELDALEPNDPGVNFEDSNPVDPVAPSLEFDESEREAVQAMALAIAGEDSEPDFSKRKVRPERSAEEIAFDNRFKNCGQFDDKHFIRNEPLCQDCADPYGNTTWVDGDGNHKNIQCSDDELSACPSTSGSGCGLLGKNTYRYDEEDPRYAKVHVDIAGHMHDLCCVENYEMPDGASYGTSCNGCTASGGSGKCSSSSFWGNLISKPQNLHYPCSVEWRFAINFNMYVRSYWYSFFDTTVRWTPSQVLDRNMNYFPGRYAYPEGNQYGAPYYGDGLAPSHLDWTDHRAPSGQYLGNHLLSQPYRYDHFRLGLSADQIGSFCQSQVAYYQPHNAYGPTDDGAQGYWRCQ